MAAEMRVPFLDLAAQYAPLKSSIREAIDRVLDTNAYILGPAVAEFERDFAAYCDTAHCVAVSSGTDALHLAFVVLGIGPGDEVITQANTFVATLEAIAYTGATPVLVDVAPPSYAIDVDAVAAKITSRTKAIVPVHLFGQPAPLAQIEALAAAHGIAVIEDASQAHGARYDGSRIGSRNMSCFSFYPGKNLGAYGEGGAVVTADASLAERMRVLRSHGSAKRYQHDVLGYNYRMDGIQGAVLGVKLPHVDEWNEGRRKIAKRYDAAVANIEKPSVPSNVEHVYHIYPVFVDNRDAIRAKLADAGIETNVHYPGPASLQPAFAYLGYKAGDFPHSEMIAERELSLPIYAEMSAEAADYVATELVRALASAASNAAVVASQL